MKTTQNSSSLLRDDITGDWVIVAPGRKKRPNDIGKKRVVDVFSPKQLASRDILATYGRDADRMTIVGNAFPVFQPDRGVKGRQEIIVEGMRTMPFARSTLSRIEALMNAFVARFAALRADPKIMYIQAFKNEGIAAGASQPHPHSQIFALSFVPERIRDEARRRRSAAKRLGKSAHEYALSLAMPERIIYADRNVVAFANPAARFAYEVRIVPRKRRDNITQTTLSERKSLARAIHTLLPFIRKRNAGFNLFFHDVKDERDEHFEIRFTPRLNIWGGFELDAGVFVNPVPAEDAAAAYREAAKKKKASSGVRRG
jgi:UDPglucose--hexose-1-phosphate uridylyltransferase